jgi:hypothetical protein
MDLLEKACNLFAQEKYSEAKCFLEISALDPSPYCAIQRANLLVKIEEAMLVAQNALITAERRQREKVELLENQVELCRVKGMRLAFCNFLKDVERLSIDRHQHKRTPHPLHCFISYAWETDPVANKELQQRLQLLKDELETAGMEVTLDIRDMKYDMKKFMVKNIQKAHKLLLICTPRLRERASDPIKNNLQLELKTALEKEKTTPNFITPMLLSGTVQNAMPPQVNNVLAVHLTPQSDHYLSMASLTPMGLIPMLLGLERDKDYKHMHARLLAELAEVQQQSTYTLSPVP